MLIAPPEFNAMLLAKLQYAKQPPSENTAAPLETSTQYWKRLLSEMPLSCHLHPALKVHIYVVIFLSSSCYAPTFHCTDLLYSSHIWAYTPFF